jgi:hypothetical protein
MMQQQLEKRLKDIRPGALFTTRSGIMAVKTAYIHDSGQCKCVRLEDGQSPHFSEGDMTPVREVELEGQAVAAEPEHEHTFTIAASRTVVARMCTGCGMTWILDWNHALQQFKPNRWYQVRESADVVGTANNEEHNVPLEVQKEVHARIFDGPPDSS